MFFSILGKMGDPLIQNNPWHINSFEEFRYYCCPECDMKTKQQHELYKHAMGNHEKAKETLSANKSLRIKGVSKRAKDYGTPTYVKKQRFHNVQCRDCHLYLQPDLLSKHRELCTERAETKLKVVASETKVKKEVIDMNVDDDFLVDDDIEVVEKATKVKNEVMNMNVEDDFIDDEVTDMVSNEVTVTGNFF